MNSVIELMERDHRGMEMLFCEIDKIAEPLEREIVFAELADLYEAHARAEEGVVYPLLSTDDTAETWVDGAEQEHRMARDLIRRVRQRHLTDPEWLETVQRLRQLLNVHVSEEENCIFPRMREIFTASQLNQLAIDFRMMKEEWANVG